MNALTFGQIRTQIELELDLQNETNITADEKVAACNDAVQSASAEIHKIHEDYFLKSATLTFVNGTATYSLPADIYAEKIRDVVYNNGSGIIYKIRRIRGDRKFIELALTNQFGTALDYKYIIQNTDSTTGYQIVMVPPARESGAVVTLWYLRTCNRIPLVTGGSQAASDAIVVDIPEFYTFIKKFMAVRFLLKDGADPRLPAFIADMEQERIRMVDTLTGMIPDDDDQIMPDFTHYYEHE